jgi:hypothetical protein
MEIADIDEPILLESDAEENFENDRFGTKRAHETDSKFIQRKSLKPNLERVSIDERNAREVDPPIRVSVGDIILLIPLRNFEREHTISSLKVEIADKYFLQKGYVPNISAIKCDGAILCDDYFIRDVVMPGASIIAELSDVQNQSLEEMFMRFCIINPCVCFFCL